MSLKKILLWIAIIGIVAEVNANVNAPTNWGVGYKLWNTNGTYWNLMGEIGIQNGSFANISNMTETNNNWSVAFNGTATFKNLTVTSNITLPTIIYNNSNVTTGRAFNTVYTNPSNNKSIEVFVVARVQPGVGGSALFWGLSDSAIQPTTNASGRVGIESGILNEEGNFQLIFFTSPNTNYSVNTTGTVMLRDWRELYI